MDVIAKNLNSIEGARIKLRSNSYDYNRGLCDVPHSQVRVFSYRYYRVLNLGTSVDSIAIILVNT